MPFTRFFSSFPTQEQITQIEGIFIVDQPPPTPVQGASSGRSLLVGEFSDMRLAVTVNATTGVVTTKPKGDFVFTAADLLSKGGGFDETLGEFGGAEGNAFVAIRNKSLPDLVIVPVNLASSRGVRLFRQLPTNKSATDPTPIVPVLPAGVDAGRLFKTGAARVKSAGLQGFNGRDAISTGTDGTTAAGAAAATFAFTSASATFLTDGVEEGDALVIGVIGAAGEQGNQASTYRIVAIPSETSLTVQKQDGSNYTPVTFATFAYRVHKADEADSGGQHQLSFAGSYAVPARPITNSTGGATDGVIPAATVLTPVVVPTPGTASTWDPLSGLEAMTDPTTGLVFTAAVQKPNAPNSSALDTLYGTALDATIVDNEVFAPVSLVWCARSSATIRSKLKTHAQTAALSALLRVAVISPELSAVLTTSQAVADTSPGVGATRDSRVAYDWPGVQTSIPEAVGFRLARADGTTTLDGILDVKADSWLVSVMAGLPPENDPGQVADPVPTLLGGIEGIQTGVDPLSINDYIALRRAGICGAHIDRTVGPEFYSGVLSALPLKDINQRRFADFVELSLAAAYKPYKSLKLSDTVKDSLVAVTVAFCIALQSTNNPAAQRIAGFSVDGDSANTPQTLDAGIYLVKTDVQMLAIGKFIGIVATVGPTVSIVTNF